MARIYNEFSLGGKHTFLFFLAWLNESLTDSSPNGEHFIEEEEEFYCRLVFFF